MHRAVLTLLVTLLASGSAPGAQAGKPGSPLFTSKVITPKTPGVAVDIKAPVAAASKQKADSIAYLPANMFTLPEGYEITVWAKSPLFFNPTNMDIDEKGRIWVAEGRNYRGRKGCAEGDRIVVLEDADGDGVAETSHVFVQSKNLVSPLGVAVVDNKVIVSQPPDLIVFTDVNRNAVFDEGVDTRDVLLTGFDGRNHDHSLHSVTVGPSGQWYFNHGNKGSSVTDKEGWHLNAGSLYSSRGVSGKPSSDGQVYVGGVALRMNADGTGLRPIGHNFRNSYEQAITSFGDVFQNDNDDPPACRTAWLMEYGNMGYSSRNGLRKWHSDKVGGQATPVAEWRQEDPGVVPAGDVYGGGAPTGIAVYENGIMENALRGYVINCEPARNTLFGYHPQAKGAGLTLPERDIFLTTNPEGIFAGVDFRNAGGNAGHMSLFRPSDVAIGPDGAIYVADWFDYRVGGHSTRDAEQTGTIYRIAPKGAKLSIPTFDLNTIAGQITALKSPAPNVRELGRAKLEAGGAASVAAVKALLADPNPYIQARAIWLLAKLGPAGLKAVEQRLLHADPQMRIAAFRALRHEGQDVLLHAASLAKDKDATVRREVALALRYIPFVQCKDILMDLANGHDGVDRYYVEAFGIACTDKEENIYAALKVARQGKTGFDPVYANLVWRLQPVSAIPELEGWALDPARDEATRRAMLFSISLIEARQAAEAMVKIAKAGTDRTSTLARAFVAKRAQGIWSSYKPVDMLNGKPSGPTVYADMLAPERLGEDRDLPSAEAILALAGDAERGEMALGRCYVCHQIGSVGVEFGPALTGWGRGQAREVILRGILEPSADLAHGFKGTELTVKGNKRLQGFMQAEGDPLVIRVFGGHDVVVDKADVLARKTLETSLMVPGSKFGLSGQEIRDIVEYLKLN
ncbi:MAG: dehydrogenase [Kiritimatiellae bacterium]|nr:dehydrogenase [Kiritimatiellia bacterium]